MNQPGFIPIGRSLARSKLQFSLNTLRGTAQSDGYVTFRIIYRGPAPSGNTLSLPLPKIFLSFLVERCVDGVTPLYW